MVDGEREEKRRREEEVYTNVGHGLRSTEYFYWFIIFFILLSVYLWIMLMSLIKTRKSKRYNQMQEKEKETSQWNLIEIGELITSENAGSDE